MVDQEGEKESDGKQEAKVDVEVLLQSIRQMTQAVKSVVKRRSEETDEGKKETGTEMREEIVELGVVERRQAGRIGLESAECEIGESAGDWGHLYGLECCAACGRNPFECRCRDVVRSKVKRDGERGEKRMREGRMRDLENTMDWTWEQRTGSSLDRHMRDLREEMIETSLRIERLERAMPLGCKESGSSSGGGEWALWSGAWWGRTKMRMNSANRAISRERQVR